MDVKPVNRNVLKMTDGDKERLARVRAQVAAELPDLIQRDELRKEAQNEPTLTGELRRAVHRSKKPLVDIANQSGVTTIQLDEFLTGERTLRSDVLDRLAAVLSMRLQSVE